MINGDSFDNHPNKAIGSTVELESSSAEGGSTQDKKVEEKEIQWMSDTKHPTNSRTHSMTLESKSSSVEDDSTQDKERDEEKEIRLMSRRDTKKVIVWRTIVIVLLFVTGLAVTWTTYRLLEEQQTDSFKKQFKQFSRTVADAALDQQKRARGATRGMADTLSAYAQSTNATWPFFHMPLYESYAKNVIHNSRVEVLALFPLVRHEQLNDYLAFVNRTHMSIVEEAHMIRKGNLDSFNPVGYHPYITQASPQGFIPDIERDFYFPGLHFAPAPRALGFTNWNVYSLPTDTTMFNYLLEMKTETLISVVRPYAAAAGIAFTLEEHEEMHKHVYLEDSTSESPHAFMYTPVYERVGEPDTPIVALCASPFAWDVFMIELLPQGIDGIAVVLENDCGQAFSYEVNGPTVRYLGEGDLHETKYNGMVTYQDLTDGFHSHPQFAESEGHCRYSIRIYPTTKFKEGLHPNTPKDFAAVVASAFFLVIVVFFVYDLFVQRRNEKLVKNAAQSNAIVSSLFPSNIRDRLVNQPQRTKGGAKGLKNFMAGTAESNGLGDTKKPLADLFLEATICFADISAFTAWSSVREPTQVLLLLEAVYGAFDQIAKRRRVFKVETVGDCYVAATGIPEYRKDHAVVMVRFARDILAKMNVLTKELEKTLGPDTGDLSLRVGLHTGPVTAGVLRGERARFQLFGDSVNMCSRVESTGVAGRIHVSSETAEGLRKNGKSHWLVKREGKVEAKGLGELQTYWIGMGVENDRRTGSDGASNNGQREQETSNIYEPIEHDKPGITDTARTSRLVDWNVEMLSQVLKQIVARREGHAETVHTSSPHCQDTQQQGNWSTDFKPLDEVEEIIPLPKFDAKSTKFQEDPESVELPPIVLEQLRGYVEMITGMYRENAFHNFEHASHVTMSVVKLLARIVAPTEQMEENNDHNSLHATLHDHTYGITSDPLTQFSCAFAAMIHDVDHTGVPNTQLVKEGARIAHLYGNRSVAEQNSLVLAWDLLMGEDYDDFRSLLCANEDELGRFRQLVVNAVMATDIVDKDLKALRNGRWNKAFHEEGGSDDEEAAVNRKATIVIEHLIQASDVAHTMQHWHVYRKWNEKFFQECYAAYQAGRAEKDPSEGWYKGELGFFDFYVIPLAKKLKECGVFGKSSDEYLNYALANRREWENRGQEVVDEMVAILKERTTSME